MAERRVNVRAPSESDDAPKVIGAAGIKGGGGKSHRACLYVGRNACGGVDEEDGCDPYNRGVNGQPSYPKDRGHDDDRTHRQSPQG